MANEETPQPAGEAEEQGLPMTRKWDPEELAKEVQQLEELNNSPFVTKMGGYIKRSGPGLLQSAMTLGAGSAVASVVAGASFGYELLWVQPVAMFLGIMMFAALGNIVLTKGERPYPAFSREMFFLVPLLWALGTIIASVIWHFPQYGLAAGAARDLAQVFTDNPVVTTVKDSAGNLVMNADGTPKEVFTTQSWIASILVGVMILAINIVVTWNYGRGSRGIKVYEWFLRTTIGIVIIAFGAVVMVTGVDWGELFKGFFYFQIPPVEGVVTVILGAIGASVGINMTFLYPYTLLAKGWGNAHKGVARADLVLSMFIPFVLVTTLVIIALANTVYPDNIAEFKQQVADYNVAKADYDAKVAAGEKGLEAPVEPVRKVDKGMKPIKAAQAFAGIAGEKWGRIIFDLGFIAMTCGAISTHMVVCGFTIPEVLRETFGVKYTGKLYRICTLVPAIGILGVITATPMWLPIAASAICLTMLPIAYIAIFIMNNKKSYLGDATGHGLPRVIFNVILLSAIALCTIGAAIKFKGGVIDKIMPAKAATPAKAPAEPAAPAPAAKPTEGGPEAPPAGE